MAESATDRETWLEQRRHGIGGSDAPAILGLSTFSTPLDVFASKLGLGDGSEQTEAQRWGLLLEPVILDEYGERAGRKIERWQPYTLWRAKEPDWLMCTPDGFAVRPDGSRGIVQCKTASASKEGEWSEDEPPIAYQVQLQHEMAATGCAWGALAALLIGFAPKLKWWEVARDDDFITKLLAQEAAFWKRVQDQDAPPPTSPEDQAAWLKRFYPRHADEKVVTFSVEIQEADQILMATKAQIKHLETAKVEQENRIKEAMGDAEIGILPSAKYTWKTTKAGVRPLKRSERE